MLFVYIYSKEWAEKRLIDRHNRDSSFNFLLRQSEKEFDEFTLVYMGSQRPIFLQIKQTEDGQYQLIDKEISEPLFSSMTELIDYYRRAGQDGKSAISLKKCVFPVNPRKCNQIFFKVALGCIDFKNLNCTENRS
jgi:SH2 domain